MALWSELMVQAHKDQHSLIQTCENLVNWYERSARMVVVSLNRPLLVKASSFAISLLEIVSLARQCEDARLEFFNSLQIPKTATKRGKTVEIVYLCHDCHNADCPNAELHYKTKTGSMDWYF